MTHCNSSDRGFEITSLVNVEKRPHCLSVLPNLFSDLISGDFLWQQVSAYEIQIV